MQQNRTLRQAAGSASRYLYVAPAFLFFVLFIIYPLISNVLISMNDTGLSLFSDREFQFVGLSKYIELFTSSDRLLITAIRNTLVFTFFTITVQIVVSFALSLIFCQKLMLAKAARGVILIAYILPPTVSTLLFKFMFMTDGGIINYALLSLGIIDTAIPWLINANTAMATIISTNVWINAPFSMLLFTSGLMTVDPSHVEAAMIDGAGYWRRLFSIIIPSISETTKIVLTLGIIYSFKVFDVVFIMTGGGPGQATEVLATLAYRTSFTLYKYGEGAVVSNVLLAFLLVVGCVYIRLIKHEE